MFTSIDLATYLNFSSNNQIIMAFATMTFTVIIGLLYLYITYSDKIDKNKLIDDIPVIINLAQRVEFIQNYVHFIINYEQDLPLIPTIITPDTELTYSQINLLNFIKELEQLNKVWDVYKDNGIISNSDIRMPYAIAYNIRELIDIPVDKKEDEDEDDDDDMWLSKEESDCLIKYNSKIKTPLISPIEDNKNTDTDLDENTNLDDNTTLQKDKVLATD